MKKDALCPWIEDTDNEETESESEMENIQEILGTEMHHSVDETSNRM